MKRLLYIHIGTHKTGTTTIQTALYRNAVTLKREGIVYLPRMDKLPSLVRTDTLDDALIENIKNELHRNISKYRKNTFRFLLSWEGFSGNPYWGYQNFHIMAPSLKKITEGFDVRIIVYLRRQDHFIESLYTEMIRQGDSYDFNTFIKDLSSKSFNWEELLECYASHFGQENLIVRRYDKQFFPDKISLLASFAKIIDSKCLLEYKEEITRNRGYSRDVLEIARLVNSHLNSEERILFHSILQKTNTKQIFDRYSFWTDTARNKFLNQYAISNANVARKYFDEGEYDNLFPESNLCEEHVVYNGLSSEVIAVTLSKAIVVQNQQLREESYLLQLEYKILNKLKQLLPSSVKYVLMHWIQKLKLT